MTAAEIKALRERVGLTQAEFAAAYRLPMRTYQDWERGKRQPGAAGEALLLAIERDPITMRELLED